MARVSRRRRHDLLPRPQLLLLLLLQGLSDLSSIHISRGRWATALSRYHTAGRSEGQPSIWTVAVPHRPTTEWLLPALGLCGR